MTRLTPAQYVIRTFGSIHKVATAIGKTPGAVWRWKSKGSKAIPGPSQQLILQAAKKLNLDITPNDLIYGREVSS